jgi:hypothetical protein
VTSDTRPSSKHKDVLRLTIKHGTQHYAARILVKDPDLVAPFYRILKDHCVGLSMRDVAATSAP